MQPILVSRDGDSRMIVCFLMQERSVVNDHVIRRLLQFFRELDDHESKVMILSDQESLVWAVAEKLAKERSEAQTIMEHSPVRSSGFEWGRWCRWSTRYGP